MEILSSQQNKDLVQKIKRWQLCFQITAPEERAREIFKNMESPLNNTKFLMDGEYRRIRHTSDITDITPHPCYGCNSFLPFQEKCDEKIFPPTFPNCYDSSTGSKKDETKGETT